ncbi:glutathione S-transferase family protein [Ideonella sp. A 288]|uniref:glutathione S-transferase family protein n=1 Tax=Ideonella sp. A 288 TaxID=1962181 RepID=UPI001303A838|nr:glutathione S-transferase family protein [Ideonella sp. A 288]
MIELLQFKPAFGLMNASPFCMKVEVFLRLAGLEYRCVDGQMPMGTPKGKLPVLRDGDALVADSQAIVEHLQRRHGERMPAALRAPDSPQGLALRRMLEEHTYFTALWLRWVDDAGWRLTAPAFFGHLPWPLRHLAPALVRHKMRRDLVGQGMGRHSRDEICARAIADLHALVGLLGDRPFFGGGEPRAVDATAYAFLANLLWTPFDHPVRATGLRMPTLLAYAERMDARIGR